MRILGIDPSLAASAVVELDGGKVSRALVWSGSAADVRRSRSAFEVRRAEPVARGDAAGEWQRIVDVSAALAEFCAPLAEVAAFRVSPPPPGADAVGIEDHAPGARGASSVHAPKLGHLQGLVRYGLNRRLLPYLPLEPSAVKLYATGKGNAQKPAMVAVSGTLAEQLPELDGVTQPTREALVDAYWIARLTLAWQLVRTGKADPREFPEHSRRVFGDRPRGALRDRPAILVRCD